MASSRSSTILIAYKTIGRPIAIYDAPIWTPQLTNTRRNSLQATQNAALSTATGCHLMLNIHHLHQETNILPIKPNSILLSKQYTAACHLHNNPWHDNIYQQDNLRHIRRSIKDYLPVISALCISINKTTSRKQLLAYIR